MDATLNLSKLAKHFSDEMAARELLESMRWPNGPECCVVEVDETMRGWPSQEHEAWAARRGQPQDAGKETKKRRGPKFCVG